MVYLKADIDCIHPIPGITYLATILRCSATATHTKTCRTFLKKLEEDFIHHGGIKERMYAARTGYRKDQDEELQRLKQEVPSLQRENERLSSLITSLQAENKSLRQQVPILNQRIETLETEKKHLQVLLAQARNRS